jgi:regulator of protease activity HflC (stomatin/prohibitin superfamily)
MTWLILTVLLGIVFWGAVIVAVMAGPHEAKEYDDSLPTRGTAVALAAVTAVIWVGISLFMGLHTVGQRQVAIVYNFSGTITGKKDPGVVMTWPWQHVKKENVGLQREDFTLDTDNAAVSQDQQAIYARLTVNFQVLPEKVVKLYKEVGPSWKQTLLDSRVLQDFKEVTSLYTAAQITTKRQVLRADTKARLAAEMAKYDVRITDVFVRNLDYTQSYKNAINAKNVQVQRSLEAEAKVNQSRAEGEQQLALAQKQAQANKVLAQSITPQIIQLRAIEKLNPSVQVIYVPQGSSLFLPQVAGSGTGR